MDRLPKFVGHALGDENDAVAGRVVPTTTGDDGQQNQHQPGGEANAVARAAKRVHHGKGVSYRPQAAPSIIKRTSPAAPMHLNLINVFTFYLSATFLISTVRRWQQYHDITRLVIALPGRWPLVMRQIHSHRAIFATWAIVRPLAIALALLLIQWICSKLIWPTAKLTGEDIMDEWWMLPLLGPIFLTMLAVDTYFLVRVGQLDRIETEKYLDEAEKWLKSWKSPLIRTVTLGYINPRRMVDEGVRKALEDSRGLISSTLWWVSLQTGLRLVAGALLWMTWALHPGIEPAVPMDEPRTQVRG